MRQGCRIAVIGNSGSGKSTLARALSGRLGIPHVELDALNWQPGWRALSVEEPDRFARAVGAAIGGDAWVTDGNYTKGALMQILPVATDVVWLDLPRRVIVARVVLRSAWRALLRRELWPGTGNRETMRRWLRKDHPIRWTWDTYAAANARRAGLFADPALAQARLHRLRTPADVRRWLRTAAPPPRTRTPPPPPPRRPSPA